MFRARLPEILILKDSKMSDHWAHNYVTYAPGMLAVAALLIGVGGARQMDAVLTSGLGLMLLVLFFFRNPAWINLLPLQNDAVVSPVSALVTQSLPGNAPCIDLHLSLLDEHVLLAPVAGTVEAVFEELRPNDLERQIVLIRDKISQSVVRCEFGVRQPGYAGFLPALLIGERVKISVVPGQFVTQNERMGMIRFGSTAAVCIDPAHFELVVAPGDRVVIGTSVVARRRL